VAAISREVNRNLLPDPDEETELITRMVDLGAVDGVVGKSQYAVDAMDLDTHGQALLSLRALLDEEGVR
jgi:hypothetical protein